MTAPSLLSRFLHAERGNMAVILAIALLPLIIGVGVAVDASRAYVVRSRLAFALDAAGLAVGGSQGTEAELQVVMENYFYKNYPADVMGTPVGLQMVLDSVNNTVTLSASASLETMFLRVAGLNLLTVSYSNEITREIKGLEVVLALDTTGSMASSGKISGLRVAAQDLVDILFGSQTNPEKLKMGLVPFATAVNIGNSNTDLVNWGASQWTRQGNVVVNQSSYTTDEDGTSTGTVWKGCVKERAYPDDVSDTGGVNGKWDPYFWPKEPRSATGSTSANTYCANRSSSHGVTTSDNVGLRWDAIDEIAADSNYGQAGPNKACPRALLPMTNARTTIESEIGALVPWGDDTGTIVHVGLAWALRAISPEAPFTQGIAWNAEGWNKAIILMTDGDNTSIRQSSRCRTTNNGSDHSYTGYGYTTDEGTLGTDAVALNMANLSASYNSRAALAVANENARLLETCNNVKAKGIILYTIAFGTSISSTAQSLLSQCATDPDKFFASATSGELSAAFTQIARELSKLRISR
ncbi:MAG: pilus assembly protein [Alphaproteobacteria bacterium]|nr:pilus assembly protein [Alphaproteobacteria bacterium]